MSEPTVEQRAEWNVLANHLVVVSRVMASWIGPGTGPRIDLTSKHLRAAAEGIRGLIDALERAEARIKELEAMENGYHDLNEMRREELGRNP